VLLCALTSFGIYGGASCGSGEATGSATSSAGTGGAAANPALVFEGDANDAAYSVLTSVQGPDNPATYAIFDTPAEAAAYPSGSVPTFTWHMNAQPGAGKDGGAFLLSPAAPARRASLGPLLDLFAGERSAAAQGNPVNGLGYLLLFSTEKNNDLLRVFTTKTTYTPAGGALEIMKGAEGLIQVWILTGLFKDNALTADGGPFRGPWTSYTLTK
jgi:hypothetical protein